MPKVIVDDQDVRFSAPPGANLRVELLKRRVKLYQGFLGSYLNCHGKGLCGTCLVRVTSNPAGLTDRTETENVKLFGSNPQVRLACQAQICGDIALTCDIDRTEQQPENQVKVDKRPF